MTEFISRKIEEDMAEDRHLYRLRVRRTDLGCIGPNNDNNFNC